jgi:hypothetical protein
MAINILSSLTAISNVTTEAGNTPAPGQVNLKQCVIQHGDDKFYDVSTMVSEIHMFEDIETVGVTGWIQMIDNINVIRNGVILGEELLWIKFETAGASEAGQQNFAVDYSSRCPLYIHKIEEITSPQTLQGTTTQSVLEYRLHFCSTEMITNDRIRISKAYQGTISEIVKEVMEKDLGVTKKPVTITETTDRHHYVVPNMRPFDFILSLAERARCPTYIGVDGPQPAMADNLFKGQHSDFIFFETAKRPISTDGGWFFVPLQRESMAVAEDAFGGDGAAGPDLIFTLNNSATTSGAEESTLNAGVTGYPAAMLRSLNFEFVTTGDKWHSVADGSWCGTDIRHNSYKKSFDIFKSDYLKQLKRNTYSHASKTPVYWPPDPSWRKISEWPESNVSFSSSPGSNSVSNINANTRRADYPWRKTPPEHSLQRRMQVNHMLNYERVQCEMYGISGLQIGKMAQTEFPQIGLFSGTPDETGLEGSEDVYGEDRNNNTWMITKIAHHIIFADTIPYKSTMELANTMRTTEKELPIYGSLTGAAPGQGRGAAGR